MKVVASALGGTSAAAACPDPRSPLTGVSLRVAQFNVENFFDTIDNPSSDDQLPTQQQYETKVAKLAIALRDKLGLPDIIGLEEIENDRVLTDLISSQALKDAGYAVVLGDLNDRRGIRTGMLYRTSRVEVAKVEHPNPDMQLPGGATGQIDQGKLFARAPLVVDFRLRGAAQAIEGAETITVIANHFKSKLGGPVSDRRRIAQGEYLGKFVDDRRSTSPATPVVVLGDLNASYGEAAYDRLERRQDGSLRLHDMPLSLPESDRYTYDYRGRKDMLDHLMVTPDLAKAVTGVRIPHFDTASGSKAQAGDPTVADGVSDHDPIVADFDLSKVAQARAGQQILGSRPSSSF